MAGAQNLLCEGNLDKSVLSTVDLTRGIRIKHAFQTTYLKKKIFQTIYFGLIKKTFCALKLQSNSVIFLSGFTRVCSQW